MDAIRAQWSFISGLPGRHALESATSPPRALRKSVELAAPGQFPWQVTFVYPQAASLSSPLVLESPHAVLHANHSSDRQISQEGPPARPPWAPAPGSLRVRPEGS